MSVKKPRTLRELVDVWKAELGERADALAFADPSTVAHAIEVGKYRGWKECIDRIEDLMKQPKEDDDE